MLRNALICLRFGNCYIIPENMDVMKVTGAEFRIAKTGKYAGKLSIIVKGTDRTAYVTKEEIRAFTA